MAMTEEDLILEALCRHQLPAASRARISLVLVGIRYDRSRAADPSPELLGALQSLHPNLKPIPEWPRDGMPTGTTSLDNGPVQMDGADRATVEGAAGPPNGPIREVEYKLERSSAGWAVVSERVLRMT